MLVAQSIEQKLQDALSPLHLDVINESRFHHVPSNSETHFKVVLVSEQFDGKPLIARHRAVNSALAEEFANGLHALSLHTYTLAEWKELENVPSSPKCKG